MKFIEVLQQALRFGLVGLLATGLHVGVFITLIEWAGFTPLLSNLWAWLLAFGLSFFGHFHWTFAHDASNRTARDALPRFLLVSLFGLGLNSCIVILVVNLADWPYGFAAALMATVVPATLFVISKWWAFARPS